MGGEEDGFGDAVLEADERVFPVADMVPESDVEDGGSKVVGVEIEPESIDDAVPFVHQYEDCRGGRVAAWFGKDETSIAFGFAEVRFGL